MQQRSSFLKQKPVSVTLFSNYNDFYKISYNSETSLQLIKKECTSSLHVCTRLFTHFRVQMYKIV